MEKTCENKQQHMGDVVEGDGIVRKMACGSEKHRNEAGEWKMYIV